MQMHASKVDSSKVLDTDLVIMERNGTESRKQDTSRSLRNYLTHIVDADIGPVNNQVPFAEKCVFNANHDDCITKFLKEVNSHAKVQSPESRNNIKPTKRIPNVKKPKRWIFKGYSFSPNKSSVVHKKPNTPRSCLRWKPTGRIFKIAGLSSGLVQNLVSPTPYVSPSKKDYEILFQSLFYEYFNPPPHVISPYLEAVAAPRVVDLADSPLSTTIDQDVPSASTSPTNKEIQFQVTHQDPSSEETTLQWVIPSNLHHLNQSFDTLTKLTKNHPLENVIGDPSRPVLTRSQLQEHAIWCYFDINDNQIPFGGKRSG
nr:hypothetical protein [Tanacetum cinerariifolium]